MLDISTRLLPLLEFVYTAVEDTSARSALAKAIATAFGAEWVVLRVTRSSALTPSPEPTPFRLVGRWDAWPGGELEVVVCRHEAAPRFDDADCRLFASFVPHLSRAARLGQWGFADAMCQASTSWAGGPAL